MPQGEYRVTVSLTTTVSIAIFGSSYSKSGSTHTVTVNTENLVNRKITISFMGTVARNYPVTVTFVKV